MFPGFQNQNMSLNALACVCVSRLADFCFNSNSSRRRRDREFLELAKAVVGSYKKRGGVVSKPLSGRKAFPGRGRGGAREGWGGYLVPLLLRTNKTMTHILIHPNINLLNIKWTAFLSKLQNLFFWILEPTFEAHK